MRTPRSDSSTARCGAAAQVRVAWGRHGHARPVPRIAIAAGRFRVDAEAVADKLLADLYVSLARKPGHH
jgi:hypothetical protein